MHAYLSTPTDELRLDLRCSAQQVPLSSVCRRDFEPICLCFKALTLKMSSKIGRKDSSTFTHNSHWCLISRRRDVSRWIATCT